MASDHRHSLRGLARELGVQHSALSKAFHEGRWTTGVQLQGGRIVIVDRHAAVAGWRAVHVPRIDDYGRGNWPQRPPPPPPDALAAVHHDVKMDVPITVAELFADRDAHSLLATALAAALLDAVGDRATVALLGAQQLHVVAELHGAHAAEIDRAKDDMETVLDMLDDVAAEAAGH